MKKYVIISFSLFLVCGISGCKKKEFKPIPSTTPVFSLSGTFGGNPIQFNAGDGDTVMSAYQWQWNNVVAQTGILGNATNYIKIELLSGDINLPSINSQYMSMMIVEGAYIPAGAFSTLNKSQLSNASAFQKLTWNYNGQSLVDNLIFQEPGKYTINADIVYNDGMSNQVSNDIFVGYDSHQLFKLETSVQSSQLTGTIVSSEAIDSVQWLIGGTHSFSTVGTQIQFGLSDSSNIIQAKVFFQNGLSRVRNLVFDKDGQTNYLEDYVYLVESSLQNRLLDYKAKVEIAINGAVYKSEIIEDQLDNMIVVSKKEQYIDELTGKKAVKLTAKLHANFKSLATGEIVEGIFDVVMAFPYEE
jgi:hypothetical protein